MASEIPGEGNTMKRTGRAHESMRSVPSLAIENDLAKEITSYNLFLLRFQDE